MVRTEELLLDLIDLIYAAAVDLDAWPQLLDRVCDIAPGAQAALLFIDTKALDCDHTITARWDADFVGTYVDHYASVNPWIPALARMPVGRPYSPTSWSRVKTSCEPSSSGTGCTRKA